ncbi:MAG: GNAT family N-acetyltransferase [Candidatus Cardinium sp.]|nr:GNAT family N-acetyltransferase [Candidatus Cardinium sp.]
MEIEYTSNPKHEEINYLTNQLSQSVEGVPFLRPFAFFIKSKDKQIKAGVNGFLIYGAIYTDQLWVSPQYRKQGLGSQLMKEVHQLGYSENCAIATVATMSFSGARKFYEKLGYVVEFVRSGYKHTACCIYLIKKLL